VIAAALVFAAIFFGNAYAQSFPIPPPLPSGMEQQEHIAPGDKKPPKIEILTHSLHAGKNVFEVKITDESTLRVREVRYVQDGQFKTDGLFRDQNDVYKALIDIQPPSRIIVVTAGDAAGNLATSYQEYDIDQSPDLFKEIIGILSSIPDYLQKLLGGLMP
jgi:hypothetical protein